jgi:hypothetical protein
MIKSINQQNKKFGKGGGRGRGESGPYVQVKFSGERFAFFARGVGSAVEELFEHGELGAGETFAGTLCGGGIGCVEEAFIGGGAEAGGGFGAEEVSTNGSHEAQGGAVA